MEFVGVSEEESHMTTLGEEEGGVPVRWREDCYVEGLVRENERWRKRKLKERERVEFVGERGKESGGSASASGSGKGTPVAGAEGQVGKKEGKRSRFDQK